MEQPRSPAVLSITQGEFSQFFQTSPDHISNGKHEKFMELTKYLLFVAKIQFFTKYTHLKKGHEKIQKFNFCLNTIYSQLQYINIRKCIQEDTSGQRTNTLLY